MAATSEAHVVADKVVNNLLGDYYNNLRQNV